MPVGPGPVPCAYTDCTIASLNLTGSNVPANGPSLSSPNTVDLSTNSIARVRWTTGTFSSVTPGGFRLTYSASSSTVPTLVPFNGTAQANITGIGGDGTNLYAILNGVAAVTWSPTTGATISGASLGAASAAHFLTVTGTWNDASTTFGGALLVNVTNTASNASSFLADFQASGASVVNISRAGSIAASANITAVNFLGSAAGSIIRLGGDTFLTRSAAASWQLGAADVDTGPIAQTLRTQGTLAGGTSNVAGANFTLIASPGKGTGASGSFVFQTAPAGSTGTAINAPVTRLTIDSTGLATFANTFALSGIGTDAATTDNTLCRITATSLVVTGSGTLGICLGTSSKRFKTDFVIFSGGIDGVMKLKLLTFRYKQGHGDNGARRQGGLLAEDVFQVFPDCVGLGPDKKPLSLDGFCISFHALKAQQEMQGEILALKVANDNLARRLAKLDGRK